MAGVATERPWTMNETNQSAQYPPQALSELKNQHERFEPACHGQVELRDQIERIRSKFDLTDDEAIVIMANEIHLITLKRLQRERA